MCLRRIAAIVLAAVSLLSNARAQVVFAEDFESGIAQWTAETPWHLVEASNPCMTNQLPFPSGSRAAWFGIDATCNFVRAPVDARSLTLTTPIVIPTGVPRVLLEFTYMSEAELPGFYDTRQVYVSTNGGVTWSFKALCTNTSWRRVSVDVTELGGQSMLVRFEFRAADEFNNDGLGWIVDDIVLRVDAQTGTSTCAGDGVIGWCPCSNLGATGHGCASSFNPAGALLGATGIPNVGADTLSLVGSGMSNSAVTFFQAVDSGSMYPFFSGDGVMCSNTGLRRIGTIPASSGAATYPRSGDAAVSVRGQVLPGATVMYAVRYRNTAPFCTPAGFNTTNAIAIRWSP